jgi:hypothetical protein
MVLRIFPPPLAQRPPAGIVAMASAQASAPARLRWKWISAGASRSGTAPEFLKKLQAIMPPSTISTWPLM